MTEGYDKPPPYAPYDEPQNMAVGSSQESQAILNQAPYLPPEGKHPPANEQYQPQQGTYPPPQGTYPPPPGTYPPPPGTYPPPQGAYPPPQGTFPDDQKQYQQQNPQQYHTNYGATTVTQQPALITGTTTTIVHMFSNQPVTMQCPHCRQLITSNVVHQSGTLAWLLCAFMFLVGLWLCCWIPFVVDDLRDSIHSCPRCGVILGQNKKM